MDDPVVLPLVDYEKTVFDLMDQLEAADLLSQQELILLKPNIVTSSPPPVTTDAGMVAAVAKYCREVSKAELLVVEGSGEGDTHQNYRLLGYRQVGADELKLLAGRHQRGQRPQKGDGQCCHRQHRTQAHAAVQHPQATDPKQNNRRQCSDCVPRRLNQVH